MEGVRFRTGRGPARPEAAIAAVEQAGGGPTCPQAATAAVGQVATVPSAAAAGDLQLGLAEVHDAAGAVEQGDPQGGDLAAVVEALLDHRLDLGDPRDLQPVEIGQRVGLAVDGDAGDRRAVEVHLRLAALDPGDVDAGLDR